MAHSVLTLCPVLCTIYGVLTVVPLYLCLAKGLGIGIGRLNFECVLKQSQSRRHDNSGCTMSNFAISEIHFLPGRVNTVSLM